MVFIDKFKWNELKRPLPARGVRDFRVKKIFMWLVDWALPVRLHSTHSSARPLISMQSTGHSKYPPLFYWTWRFIDNLFIFAPHSLKKNRWKIVIKFKFKFDFLGMFTVSSETSGGCVEISLWLYNETADFLKKFYRTRSVSPQKFA